MFFESPILELEGENYGMNIHLVEASMSTRSRFHYFECFFVLQKLLLVSSCIVLWCEYFSVYFESFALRHLVIANFHNNNKLTLVT